MSKHFRITKKRMQEHVDDFMNRTGANSFNPSDFIDFVEQDPTHPCWSILFSSGDEHAAKEHRLHIVRRLVSGLRTTVAVAAREEPSEPSASVQVEVTFTEASTVQLPSNISFRDTRVSGGGYTPTDASDVSHRRELAGQAADALGQWLERNSGLCVLLGVDVRCVDRLVDELRSHEGVIDGA